ncbi:hypothetical protein I311_06963 [Cryptococcus gattii NT-10]|nr:hypothetical protein I311_06963 [Cryptococcus gattii NT-10]
MPREPQSKERPPPPAPEHRAQLIGDLLQCIHMPVDNEWKKQSYKILFDTLCDDSAREDNYRMRLLRLFSIEYRWIGGVGCRYVNITLDSEDIGYLKSHDMSMTFLETDASQVINQLMPSKKRTTNSTKETSNVPSPSGPSSTTSGIQVPDTAIVFSYRHPVVGGKGPEFNLTESQAEEWPSLPSDNSQQSEQSLFRAMPHVLGCSVSDVPPASRFGHLRYQISQSLGTF